MTKKLKLQITLIVVVMIVATAAIFFRDYQKRQAERRAYESAEYDDDF